MASGDLVDIFDPAMTQQLPSPSWGPGPGVWPCLDAPSESVAHRLLEQPWPPVLVPSRQAHAADVAPLLTPLAWMNTSFWNKETNQQKILKRNNPGRKTNKKINSKAHSSPEELHCAQLHWRDRRLKQVLNLCVQKPRSKLSIEPVLAFQEVCLRQMGLQLIHQMEKDATCGVQQLPILVRPSLLDGKPVPVTLHALQAQKRLSQKSRAVAKSLRHSCDFR